MLWKTNMKVSRRGSGAPEQLSVQDVSAPGWGELGSRGAPWHVRKQKLFWEADAFNTF